MEQEDRASSLGALKVSVELAGLGRDVSYAQHGTLVAAALLSAAQAPQPHTMSTRQVSLSPKFTEFIPCCHRLLRNFCRDTLASAG